MEETEERERERKEEKGREKERGNQNIATFLKSVEYQKKKVSKDSKR